MRDAARRMRSIGACRTSAKKSAAARAPYWTRGRTRRGSPLSCAFARKRQSSRQARGWPIVSQRTRSRFREVGLLLDAEVSEGPVTVEVHHQPRGLPPRTEVRESQVRQG